MQEEKLAFALAATVHADGAGGAADSLTTVAELDAWLRAMGTPAPAADCELLERVRRSRRALRTLLSILTGAPRTAVDDDGAPFGPSDAVDILNREARAADAPGLTFDGHGSPAMWPQVRAAGADDRLLGALAVSAIAMVAGPNRDRLRACPAPRCVRYFYRGSARQQWRKPSCGNRARVARHYHRQRGG